MAPERTPEYLGEPTLAQVMRRPRWIAALVFALAVAAGFAWLGQWQLSSAVRAQNTDAVDTETIRPIAEADDLSRGVTERGAGVVVQVSGRLVPGDTRIVAPRENGGSTGAWVVGHLLTDSASPDANDGTGDANLAVAIGWAPNVADAKRARDRLEQDPEFADTRTFEGRYMPSEAPQLPAPSDDPQAMQSMVPAHLVNVWAVVDAPVYSGYLVVHPQGAGGGLLATGGLDAIDSVPPLPPESVNWLNVFYAVEWIVFAGFAIFLWYRLARDAWEKEHEMQLLVRADGVDPHPDPQLS